jgi:eukaryotic-like serine/threonine-protein kinase
MLSVVCTKQKTNRCIIFLPVNFSVLFLLVMIHTTLVVILLHILLQQQAMADSRNIINTADPVNTKLLISNDNNFLGYQNRAFGIMIQYPSSWEKIEEEGKEGEHHDRGIPNQVSSDERVVEFISPLERSSDKYQETLSISVHSLHTKNIGEFFGLFDKPMSQKISLHGFILSHITSLITKSPSFDLIESESRNDEITLADGSLGHKIVYIYRGRGQIGSNSSSDSNTDLKVMEVLTVKHDRGYIIRYSSEPGKYYTYLPTIQKMINSFRIMAR